MHALNEGDVIRVSKPRNHFVLYESATRFVLIAGGIGITPLLSMATRLQSLRKPFELHVCARDEAAVPFRDELTLPAMASVTSMHLDKPDGRSSLDLDKVLGPASRDTLLYLCGPQGFMNWLRESALTRGWPDANIRIESFSAPALANVGNHAFSLTLAKSRRRIEVPASQTILDALHHAGVEVPYACMQGTCGTCAAHVIEGEVDHRDAYLSESEKVNNARLCLCVSRARGDRLSIDL
jgi:vanillate O-demethylase ferredoxin subunit